jgi:hypothetical protein
MEKGQFLFNFTFILMVVFVIFSVVLSGKLYKLVESKKDRFEFWFASLKQCITEPSFYSQNGDDAYKVAKEIRALFYVYFFIGFGVTAYFIFSQANK